MSIAGDVLAERAAQRKKWGQQNHDDCTWTAILAEEVGEAAQASLPREFGRKGNVRQELVQVAAVAVAWIECLDRRPKP
jgi:NTP pyrophosphatase (non-canonical NTP hydrolase)